MIPYSDGVFGFSILFRIHGSAIYKALTPAVISSTIYGLLYLLIPSSTWHYPLFVHPYPMTALVTAFTFLLVFRANCKYFIVGTWNFNKKGVTESDDSFV
jgi:predicted membrane chloride channel (bestrophin family)